MTKRLFQVLDEMNVYDAEHKTRLVAISNNLLSADKVKQGGKVTMGVDDQCFNEIIADTLNNKRDKAVLLVVVDKKQYEIFLKSKIDINGK